MIIMRNVVGESLSSLKEAKHAITHLIRIEFEEEDKKMWTPLLAGLEPAAIRLKA